MRSNRLDDIMLFVKVVNNNSFTAAANELGISKSVISKRISRLERDLKARLMHRTTRRLTLTEAGNIFYKRCEQICNDLQEAEVAVSHHHEAPRGTLRLTSPLSFGELHLVPAIADYLCQYDEVKVKCYFGEYFADILEGGLDMAIRIGELPDSNLIAKQLASVPMRVCASPAYLQKRGVPQSPNDLYEHNCLRYHNSPTGDFWHFYLEGQLERVRVKGNFSASNSLSLEAAAVNGAGLIMLPGYMMTKDIREGKLKPVLEDFCPQDIPIYAVFPSSRHMAPKLRSFLDFLAKRFQEPSYWD